MLRSDLCILNGLDLVRFNMENETIKEGILLLMVKK